MTRWVGRCHWRCAGVVIFSEFLVFFLDWLLSIVFSSFCIFLSSVVFFLLLIYSRTFLLSILFHIVDHILFSFVTGYNLVSRGGNGIAICTSSLIIEAHLELSWAARPWLAYERCFYIPHTRDCSLCALVSLMYWKTINSLWLRWAYVGADPIGKAILTHIWHQR